MRVETDVRFEVGVTADGEVELVFGSFTVRMTMTEAAMFNRLVADVVSAGAEVLAESEGGCGPGCQCHPTAGNAEETARTPVN